MVNGEDIIETMANMSGAQVRKLIFAASIYQHSHFILGCSSANFLNVRRHNGMQLSLCSCKWPCYFTLCSSARGFDKNHLSEFQKALDHVVMKDMKNNKDNFQEAILNVEMIHKQSIHFYSGEDKQEFIKIAVVLSCLNAACSLLEGEIIIPSMNFQD